MRFLISDLNIGPDSHCMYNWPEFKLCLFRGIVWIIAKMLWFISNLISTILIKLQTCFEHTLQCSSVNFDMFKLNQHWIKIIKVPRQFPRFLTGQSSSSKTKISGSVVWSYCDSRICVNKDCICPSIHKHKFIYAHMFSIGLTQLIVFHLIFQVSLIFPIDSIVILSSCLVKKILISFK